MRIAPVVLAAVVALAVGVGLGRSMASLDAPPVPEAARTEGAHSSLERAPLAPRRGDQGAVGQEATAAAPRAPSPALGLAEGGAPAQASPPGGARAAQGASAEQTCEADLEDVRTQLAALEKRRKELEGEPIAPRTDTAPRFQAPSLVKTFDRAFAMTKLVGKVESVDCTEHPCILFGRLQGDEEGVATLEDSEPFAAYDDDVGVMLTWASADHEHGGGTKPGIEREKPPEISLFAFAYYTHEDRAQHGEMMDRRIRVRTAEYWNASTVRE